MSRRSASVALCFGFAASFCLGSGRTRSGGGVPMRARALALTALIFENVRFFDLLIGIPGFKSSCDYALLLLITAHVMQDCRGKRCTIRP